LRKESQTGEIARIAKIALIAKNCWSSDFKFEVFKFQIWNMCFRRGVIDSMRLLRALYLASRILLVLAAVYWALLLCLIGPALFSYGLDGARGKLFHVWAPGQLSEPWRCADSLRILHEGYTSMILLLLLTWTTLEVKRFLRRRLLAITARLPQSS
jgi:hypothetical protein